MDEVTLDIPFRVSWLWWVFVTIEHMTSMCGLKLPPRVVAWFAGHSVQAQINGRWQNIVVPADDVIREVLDAGR